MAFDASSEELYDHAEGSPLNGVFFDPEQVILYGEYSDEISAYRARRVWVEALEMNFFLDPSFDFELVMAAPDADGPYLLSCDFHSACARYAFWRLTNSQAPEAQYLIETAHIPQLSIEAPGIPHCSRSSIYSR